MPAIGNMEFGKRTTSYDDNLQCVLSTTIKNPPATLAPFARTPRGKRPEIAGI